MFNFFNNGYEQIGEGTSEEGLSLNSGKNQFTYDSTQDQDALVLNISDYDEVDQSRLTQPVTEEPLYVNSKKNKGKKRIVQQDTIVPAQEIATQENPFELNPVYKAITDKYVALPFIQDAEIERENGAIILKGTKLYGNFEVSDHAPNILKPNPAYKNNPTEPAFKKDNADGFVTFRGDLLQMVQSYMDFKDSSKKKQKGAEREIRRLVADHPKTLTAIACGIAPLGPLTLLAASIVFSILLGIIRGLANDDNIKAMFHGALAEEAFNILKETVHTFRIIALFSMISGPTFMGIYFIVRLLENITKFATEVAAIDKHVRDSFKGPIEEIFLGTEADIRMAYGSNLETDDIDANYVVRDGKYFVIIKDENFVKFRQAAEKHIQHLDNPNETLESFAQVQQNIVAPADTNKKRNLTGFSLMNGKMGNILDPESDHLERLRLLKGKLGKQAKYLALKPADTISDELDFAAVGASDRQRFFDVLYQKATKPTFRQKYGPVIVQQVFSNPELKAEFEQKPNLVDQPQPLGILYQACRDQIRLQGRKKKLVAKYNRQHPTGQLGSFNELLRVNESAYQDIDNFPSKQALLNLNEKDKILQQQINEGAISEEVYLAGLEALYKHNYISKAVLRIFAKETGQPLVMLDISDENKVVLDEVHSYPPENENEPTNYIVVDDKGGFTGAEPISKNEHRRSMYQRQLSAKPQFSHNPEHQPIVAESDVDNALDQQITQIKQYQPNAEVFMLDEIESNQEGFQRVLSARRPCIVVKKPTAETVNGRGQVVAIIPPIEQEIAKNQDHQPISVAVSMFGYHRNDLAAIQKHLKGVFNKPITVSASSTDHSYGVRIGEVRFHAIRLGDKISVTPDDIDLQNNLALSTLQHKITQADLAKVSKESAKQNDVTYTTLVYNYRPSFWQAPVYKMVIKPQASNTEQTSVEQESVVGRRAMLGPSSGRNITTRQSMRDFDTTLAQLNQESEQKKTSKLDAQMLLGVEQTMTEYQHNVNPSTSFTSTLFSSTPQTTVVPTIMIEENRPEQTTTQDQQPPSPQ
jgi:hypothetical protein